MLGGSWEFVTALLSTLAGAITYYRCGYLIYNPSHYVP